MIEMFLHFFLIDVPFRTGSIYKSDFPILIESYRDTSESTASGSTYAWINDHELQENLQTGLDAFMTSMYFLNAKGQVIRRERYGENSDSLHSTEIYQYAEGRLVGWKGVRETAACFYKDGKLDSVHMDFVDGDDRETYFFRFGYDPGGALVSADEITLVPNNNPGPDKRTTFIYHGGDSISVKQFSLAEPSDTVRSKVTLRNGLPVKIESQGTGLGGPRLHTKRFTYPATSGIRPVVRKARRLHPSKGTGFNLLGRMFPGRRAGHRSNPRLSDVTFK